MKQLRHIILFTFLLFPPSIGIASERIMECGDNKLASIRFEQNTSGDVFVNQRKANVIASSEDGKSVVVWVPHVSTHSAIIYRVDFPKVTFRFEVFNAEDWATAIPLYGQKCKRLD